VVHGRVVLALSTQQSSRQVERREAPRFALVLTVTLAHGVGRTRDVSASGIFFTTQGPFLPGTHIKFTIGLEHADPGGVVPIAFEGKVVRVEPRPNAIGVAVRTDSYDLGGGPISGLIP
jgi:hypothetical protein